MKSLSSKLIILVFMATSGSLGLSAVVAQEELKVCTKDGLNMDPTTFCSRTYYNCSFELTNWACLGGSIYNPSTGRCSYPESVSGCPGCWKTSEMIPIPKRQDQSAIVKPSFVCTEEGRFMDPTAMCSPTSWSCDFISTKHECPEGTIFNPFADGCSSAVDVPGCEPC